FFGFVAATPFHELNNPGFVLTTTFSTYCAFALAFSFGALVHRGAIAEATVEGLSGSYANIAYMAPGLTLAAFGSAAAAPTALIFCFDTAMLTALTPAMMALGAVHRADGAKLVRFIGRDVLFNPVTRAACAGACWRAPGRALPPLAGGFVVFVGGAAAPAGLFIVGVRLAAKPVRPIGLGAPIVIMIKLIAHPLIVYLLL